MKKHWMALVLLAGCKSVPVATSDGHATTAHAPAKAETATTNKVGTDPGHVGKGTPLSPTNPDAQLAIFAAGCFWGVESTFRSVPGVLSTAVGYTGGHTKDPTYADVCTHTTGHAEAVLVEFDPKRVSYGALLDVFFENHDPTTPNKQGPDVGDQYRSAVFTFDASQVEAVKKAIAKHQPKMSAKIVTQVSSIAPFYKAEEYHQQYHEKSGTPACAHGTGYGGI